MSALHVLIVEDSLIYRRLLSRMLTQWGYIVSEAENGVAALEIGPAQKRLNPVVARVLGLGFMEQDQGLGHVAAGEFRLPFPGQFVSRGGRGG